MPLAPAIAMLAAIGALPAFGVVAAPATTVCVIEDSRAVELSGLAAMSTGFVVINDSQFAARDMRIFYLDGACKVTRTVQYPTFARDPEDLAIAPDGTLWVADIGDNPTAEIRRRTIALWQVPAGAGELVIHRLAYPDGPHDAEAMLFTAAGVPLIITKEPSGVAGLYQPTEPLRPHNTDGVPMRRVGEFAPRSTGENNPLGPVGEVMVTAAAMSPDRSRVVLRTYTAAYEWDVPDGDIIKAITTVVPRVTSLPDEPLGEAITYTPDGLSFLTVSDEKGATALRRYDRSIATLAPAASGTPDPGPAAAPTGLQKFPPWASLVAAAVGLAMAVVGFLGLRRGRARQVSA